MTFCRAINHIKTRLLNIIAKSDVISIGNFDGILIFAYVYTRRQDNKKIINLGACIIKQVKKILLALGWR